MGVKIVSPGGESRTKRWGERIWFETGINLSPLSNLKPGEVLYIGDYLAYCEPTDEERRRFWGWR